MHPRIQEVMDYLDVTRAELQSSVENVPLKNRDSRRTEDRWSVAEVLEHLGIIEGRVGQLVSGRLAAAKAAGLSAELETSSVLDSIDRARILDRSQRATAPEMVRPHSEQDWISAWTTLQTTRADLRAALVANDGLALGELKHEHPVLGLINLYQWIIFVGAHEARHTEQIKEIAAELAASTF
ncbi:MAG: DinB family protein [Acidobacteriota bacterium]|nr:DinB family protein [Acidobacteriota bacterium]